MKSWFAVYTQPRNEHLAHEHLARQSFEVLYPRYLKRRSHARSTQLVPAPLFPRYIFVSFDPEQALWAAIRSTRGVSDLVRNGKEPIVVPMRIIDEIRKRQDADGLVVLARQLNLQKGARIRIDRGPFAAYDAVFHAQRDHERVIALLSLLGREVEVSVPIRAISPAD